MHIADLRALQAQSGQSPEQLAKVLSISSMTIRRFLRKADHAPLPDSYVPLVIEGTYALILEGKLSPESSSAKFALGQARQTSFEAAIQSLGFSQATMALGDKSDERLMIGLSQIGADRQRQAEVRHGRRKITGFQELGKEWKVRLQSLLKVISSTQLTTFEKLAAFGALFYLLAPLDLIPDAIPVFGLLDDYAILGIVAAYYLQKFPELFL